MRYICRFQKSELLRHSDPPMSSLEGVEVKDHSTDLSDILWPIKAICIFRASS